MPAEESPATSSDSADKPGDTKSDEKEQIVVDVVNDDNTQANESAPPAERGKPAVSNSAELSADAAKHVTVMFDYTGPPVTVSNGTVLDLVRQFGIQDAWCAMLKLRGWNVTKESAEPIFPIKRFRDRVRKLKQTHETLKARSDDDTTFLSKEFNSPANTAAMEAQPSETDPTMTARVPSELPGYSRTDLVIEDILRKAATEVENEAAAPPIPKAKRGRKKNNAVLAPVSTAAPLQVVVPAPAPVDQNAKIDASVESVLQKVYNNLPFDDEVNLMIPAPHQQIVWPHAPPAPQQTFYMVQDDQLYPVMPQALPPQQPLPPQPHVFPAPPQSQIVAAPPNPQTVPAAAPGAPSKAKKPRMTKKMREAAAAAAAAAAQSVGNGFLSPVPPNAIPVTTYNPNQPGTIYRAPTSSTGQQQHLVLMQPGHNQPRPPTFQQVPVGYSHAAQTSDGTHYVYNHVNEYVRNPTSSSIVSPHGQITKVVTYPTGVPLPPGVTLLTQPGQSPAPQYTQVVPTQSLHHSPQQPYLIQHPSTAPMVAPAPVPVPVPAPVVAAQPTADVPGSSSDVSLKRRRKSVKKDNTLMNFDDSDFEDLGPSQKTLTKAAKAAKKEKEDAKKSNDDTVEAPKKESTKKVAASKKTTAKEKREKENETEEEKLPVQQPQTVKETAPEVKPTSSTKADEVSKLKENITNIRRLLVAERSRHYSQKRRAVKIEDDYNRVFDRLQQTELSLAMHMSTCETLRQENYRLYDENKAFRLEKGMEVIPRDTTPDPSTVRTTRSSRRLGLPELPPINLPKPRTPSLVPETTPPISQSPSPRSSPSPSPSPSPKVQQVAPARTTTRSRAAAAAAAAAIAATASNSTAPSAPAARKKRGRARARSPSPVAEASPDSGVDAPVAESEPEQQNKPTYSASDFLPRRAAASKRIRYF